MASDATLRRAALAGILPLSPSQGIETLMQMLDRPPGSVVTVCPMDPRKLPDVPYFSAVKVSGPGVENCSENAATQQSWSSLLEFMEGDQRRAAIEDKIRTTAESLGFENLELSQSWRDAGFDSLSMVEFRNLLQRDMGGALHLSMTVLFECPCLQDLVDLIDSGIHSSFSRSQASHHDDVWIALLDFESSGLLASLESITTATFFTGDLALAVSLVRTRLELLLKANPWAAGRVVTDQKGGGLHLVHPSAPTEQIMEAILQVSPSDLNIHAGMPYEEIMRRVSESTAQLKRGHEYINKPDPVLRVTLTSDASGGFALIVSLSHTVADGHTYYSLLSMLSSHGDIHSLNPKRDPSVDSALKRSLGTNEQKFFDEDPSVNIDASLLMRDLQPLAFMVDADAVGKCKIGMEGSATGFVSTNDILTSCSARLMPVKLLGMAVNMRKRVPQLCDDDAGNYERLLIYDTTDLTPATVRASLAGPPFMGNWNEMSDFPAGNKIGMITNWSSFADPPEIDGCPQQLHLPCCSMVGNPETCIIFRPRCGQLAVLYLSRKLNRADFAVCDLPFGDEVSTEMSRTPSLMRELAVNLPQNPTGASQDKRRSTSSSIDLVAVMESFKAMTLDDGLLIRFRAGAASQTPIVFMYPGSGLPVGSEVTRYLSNNQPVYGTLAPELSGSPFFSGTLAGRARDHANVLKERFSDVGVHLVGYSFGGPVAYEIAHQLAEAGVMCTLTLLDPIPIPCQFKSKQSVLELRREIMLNSNFWPVGAGMAHVLTEELKTASDHYSFDRAIFRTARNTKEAQWIQRISYATPRLISELDLHSQEATLRPCISDWNTTIFILGDGILFFDELCKPGWNPDGVYGWNAVSSSLRVLEGKGGHLSFFTEEANVQALAEHLRSVGAV